MPITLFGQKIGQQLVDSLKHETVNALQDTNKVKLLDKLSYAYSTISPDSGIFYAQKALALATELKWGKGQANAYADLGICYNAKSNTVLALQYNSKAMALYKKLNQQRSIAAVMVNSALIYHTMGDYSRALSEYFDALKIFDKVSDKLSQAITLENIGSIYLEQKDLAKTLKYYQQARKLYEANNDIGGLARNTANIGIVYYKQNQPDKALIHHELALKLNKQIGNKYGIQNNLTNIGLVYLQQNNFQKALQAQFKALEISRELGNERSEAVSLGNIGGTYYQQATRDKQHIDYSNLTKAVTYLEKAIQLCKSTGFTAPITEFAPYLSDAYTLLGENRKAYNTLREFTTLKDSLFSIQKNIQLANLENKNLIEQQEKDILKKEQQIQAAEFKMRQQKYFSGIYVLSIVVMVLILGIASWGILSYRARNWSLSKANNEKERTIKEQLLTLQASNATLKKIAHIQSHDVRGPVATILGLAQLLNKSNPTDPGNHIIVEGISDAAQSLDEIIKKVVQLENDLGLDIDADLQNE